MCLAVLAMNIASFSATGMGASYKIIAKEGFHAAELNLIRNILTFFIAIAWCFFTDINPLRAFPADKKLPLFIRMSFG